MYSLYIKIPNGDSIKYQLSDEAHLFGCRVGLIPKLLRLKLTRQESEPLKWHISIENEITQLYSINPAVVIDVKPNSNGKEILLTQLQDVWGYSASGWTPILMKQIVLVTSENEPTFDKKTFLVQRANDANIFYSMLYLNGTIQAGNIVGRWTCPGPSSTNSVLLWPETLSYFIDVITQTTPHFLVPSLQTP
jgi:hypothetical protein